MSLVTFISWNVFCMIRLAIERMSYGSQLDGLAGDAFIKKYQALEANTKRRLASYHTIWVSQLVVAIVTAAIGMGILLVNCAINLLVIQ
jgi:hypothetical protein